MTKFYADFSVERRYDINSYRTESLVQCCFYAESEDDAKDMAEQMLPSVINDFGSEEDDLQLDNIIITFLPMLEYENNLFKVGLSLIKGSFVSLPQ